MGAPMGFEEKLAAEWAIKIRALHEGKAAKAPSAAAVPPSPTPPPTIVPSPVKPVEVSAPKVQAFKTESTRKMTKRRLALLANEDDAELVYDRPKTRGDCLTMERPCPFVSCKHHLYLDVMSSGSIHFNFPDLEVWELIDTCSLDVAEEGDVPRPGSGEGEGATLEQISLLFGITRERIRQIEVAALAKLQRKARVLRDFADGYGVSPTRIKRATDDDADVDNDDNEDEGQNDDET